MSKIYGLKCIQCGLLGKYISAPEGLHKNHEQFVCICSSRCYSKYWGIGEEMSSDLLENETGTLGVSSLKVIPHPPKDSRVSKSSIPSVSYPRDKTVNVSGIQTDSEDVEVQVTVGPKGINLLTGEFSKETMGRVGWVALSMFVRVYPDEPTLKDKQNMKMFLDGFAQCYPCEMCREHFLILYAENPPNLTSRITLMQSVSDWHNSVNNKLGKPLFKLNLPIGAELSSATGNHSCIE